MSIIRRAAFILLALAAIPALLVGAGLLAALGTESGGPAGQTAAAQTPTTQVPTTQRVITVSGQGQVMVSPDTAQVQLGVQAQGADLATVQQQVNSAMNAVLAALKSAGIPDNQIRTVVYSVSVQRDPKAPDSPITGYQVTHLVQVKVTPVDKVGAVVDAAVGKGANLVNGIQFIVENQDAAERQARQLAMADARNKAEQLAQLGSVQIGQPVTISETQASPPTPIAVPGAVARDVVSTEIQPGQSEVTVNVTVSYAIQ